MLRLFVMDLKWKHSYGQINEREEFCYNGYALFYDERS